MQTDMMQSPVYGSADTRPPHNQRSAYETEPIWQRQPAKLDFDSYYDEHIKQQVESVAVPFDNKKSSGNALFWVLISIIMISGFAIGVIGPNKVTGTIAALPLYEQFTRVLRILWIPLFLITGVCIFVYGFFFFKSNSKKNKQAEGNEQLNSIIVPEIFKYLDNGCTYNRNPSLTGDDLDFLGIDQRKLRFDCQDEVIGVHNGTAFKMMELEIERKLTSRHSFRDDYKTVFKGVYLLLDVPKSFSGRVDINRECDTLLNVCTDAFTDMQRVGLEDSKFDKVFQVLSNDQTEARYLLTTTMMQSLEHLRHLLGGSELEGSFYNGKLALRIGCSEDLFDVEPGLHAEQYRSEAHRIIGILEKILKTIDTMDLRSQRLG